MILAFNECLCGPKEAIYHRTWEQGRGVEAGWKHQSHMTGLKREGCWAPPHSQASPSSARGTEACISSVTWLPCPWSPWIGRSFHLKLHKEVAHSAWPERPLSSHVECDIWDWGCPSFASTSDTDSSQMSETPAEMRENFLWSLIKNRAGNGYRPDLLICLWMYMKYMQENPKCEGMGHN